MITIKSLAIACCVAAATLAVPAVGHGKGPDPESVAIASALKDLRYTAADAADQAAVLEELSRSVGSWQSHARKLEELRDQINQMGQILGKLENEREAATPIEREAIDRAHALLQSMADNTTAAIRYVADNPTALWKESYQKVVSSLADGSAKLDSTLGHFAQLSHVRAKEKNLEKALNAEVGE